MTADATYFDRNPDAVCPMLANHVAGLNEVMSLKLYNPKSETSDICPKPSTLNPQPSTLNPQPSTLNPIPQTLYPKP
jgi:hypothetical protein